MLHLEIQCDRSGPIKGLDQVRLFGPRSGRASALYIPTRPAKLVRQQIGAQAKEGLGRYEEHAHSTMTKFEDGEEKNGVAGDLQLLDLSQAK